MGAGEIVPRVKHSLWKREALSADPGTLESHTMHVVVHMHIPALRWKKGWRLMSLLSWSTWG